MKLSKESREFLENLRLYLFSKGKQEKEIEEIIGELEDHLHEAEKNGKSVEDIIGMTQKKYMGQVANEMSIDGKGLLKYILIIIIGAFSYILLGDAIRGELEYSLLALIGYPVIFLFILLLISILFKYVASHKISKMKEWFLFGMAGSIPVALFIGLLFLERYVETPTIQFGAIGNTVAIVFSIGVFIGISLWSKTWISIILPIILFLPEIFISKTNLPESTKLILTSTIILICMGSYFLTLMQKEKGKNKH
ncbi:hypothetical protein RCG19_08210 [Neobacillus sp. OS1-2]|uniref:HAAS domain-containing protein n=1 Tax=Neobacillus sp. OS1-2 TaxID=3070680 RepID=UPI0027E14B64|nr:hypothetical protein [Neobacillus sp. OS1-2]WML41620.1 hypothetical protein RCG19_08210 [Neobacillus sp. OS1-2]